MIATNWFQKKWGFEDTVLVDELYSRIVELEERVKLLEQENVETTNELYRMENSLDGDGNGQSSLINYSKFMKNTKFNHNNTSSHSRLAK